MIIATPEQILRSIESGKPDLRRFSNSLFSDHKPSYAIKKQLADIGLIRSLGYGLWQLTAKGQFVLDTNFGDSK